MEPSILIVDDDTNLLSVLKSFLKEQEYLVTPCSNGLEAIQKCRERTFDVVITDIMLPGATGLDVLRETRKIDPGVLVILITGFASLESAVEAIRQGAYDYITKPFTLEEIRIVVKNALEKIRLLRENQRLLEELQKAYEQLRLLKEVGGEGKDSRPSGEHFGDGKTLIAGNMLPHHFMVRNADARSSFVSDLERVSQLRDRGLISEREFELCKSRLFQNLKP